ncbi:SCO family protein [Neptuniibacter sp. QD37_6]|uniref:SCO family protein n=1 Tax=Neptuniibacter sp. QD37_6 TaxID=3398210 RepID=UPI0039F5AA53
MFKSLISSAIVLALAGGVFYYQTLGFEAYTAETKRRVEVERNPIPSPQVIFQNQAGELVSWEAFQGQYVIADFVYTRCETVCLGLGVEFARLQRQAADLISDNQLQLLTISFDPENDGPEQLAEYLNRFKADTASWKAARVEDPAQLKHLKETFGVIAINDGEGGYIHNSALHLISPEGQLMKIVDYNHGSELLTSIRQNLTHSVGGTHAAGNEVAITTY